MSPDEAVTVVVRRRVRADMVDSFEEWLRGITKAAAGFEGHAGALVLRPEDPAYEDYVIVFRYATVEQLARWERSEERAAWLARADAFTIGTPRVDRLTGLEYWFQLPGHAAHKPPPRYKMAAVTVLAIYPLVLVVVPLLAGWFARFPRPLAILLTSMILVALMTWAIMPALTRLFARWLFPVPPRS